MNQPATKVFQDHYCAHVDLLSQGQATEKIVGTLQRSGADAQRPTEENGGRGAGDMQPAFLQLWRGPGSEGARVAARLVQRNDVSFPRRSGGGQGAADRPGLGRLRASGDRV